MDPNACIEALLHAVKERDNDACAEIVENLVSWLKRGGFAPSFSRESLVNAGLDPALRYLRFRGKYYQQTISGRYTLQASLQGSTWELVEWDYHGNRVQSWDMA